jgi:hypothetical protein
MEPPDICPPGTRPRPVIDKRVAVEARDLVPQHDGSSSRHSRARGTPVVVALCLLAAGCITDPGFAVDVVNSSDKTFYIGGQSTGLYRVSPRSFGIGPGGLGERSPSMWLFDDRCDLVLFLGQIKGTYMVTIGVDGSASFTPERSSSPAPSLQSLRDVGGFDRAEQCGA